MPTALEKIKALTDEQIIEGVGLLESFDRPDFLFFHDAMLMEYERRHGSLPPGTEPLLAARMALDENAKTD